RICVPLALVSHLHFQPADCRGKFVELGSNRNPLLLKKHGLLHLLHHLPIHGTGRRHRRGLRGSLHHGLIVGIGRLWRRRLGGGLHHGFVGGIGGLRRRGLRGSLHHGLIGGIGGPIGETG